jgi:hypothetical protein
MQVFIIAFQDEDLNLSFKELVHTQRGITTVTSLIVSLCGMVPFIYIEVGISCHAYLSVPLSTAALWHDHEQSGTS